MYRAGFLYHCLKLINNSFGNSEGDQYRDGVRISGLNLYKMQTTFGLIFFCLDTDLFETWYHRIERSVRYPNTSILVKKNRPQGTWALGDTLLVRQGQWLTVENGKNSLAINLGSLISDSLTFH